MSIVDVDAIVLALCVVRPSPEAMFCGTALLFTGGATKLLAQVRVPFG